MKLFTTDMQHWPVNCNQAMFFGSGSQYHSELWVTSSELLVSSKRRGPSLTCFLLFLAELSGWTLDWLMLSPSLGLPLGSVISLVSAPVFSPGEQFPWVGTWSIWGLHLLLAPAGAAPAAWQMWEGQPAPRQAFGSTGVGGIHSAWVFSPVSLANPSGKVIFSLVYWTLPKSGVD